MKCGAPDPRRRVFDYLRIGLATAVLTWHSIILSTGSAPLDQALWSGPFRSSRGDSCRCSLPYRGSELGQPLERSRLHQFLALRCRIVPALAVVVVLSAHSRPVLTSLPLRRYFAPPEIGGFVLNIVAVAHVTLPGVFEHNPDPRFIASQLWTIPFEFSVTLLWPFLRY
jgi:hypothetical protein